MSIIQLRIIGLNIFSKVVNLKCMEVINQDSGNTSIDKLEEKKEGSEDQKGGSVTTDKDKGLGNDLSQRDDKDGNNVANPSNNSSVTISESKINEGNSDNGSQTKAPVVEQPVTDQDSTSSVDKSAIEGDKSPTNTSNDSSQINEGNGDNDKDEIKAQNTVTPAPVTEAPTEQPKTEAEETQIGGSATTDKDTGSSNDSSVKISESKINDGNSDNGKDEIEAPVIEVPAKQQVVEQTKKEEVKVDKKDEDKTKDKGDKKLMSKKAKVFGVFCLTTTIGSCWIGVLLSQKKPDAKNKLNANDKNYNINNYQTTETNANDKN